MVTVLLIMDEGSCTPHVMVWDWGVFQLEVLVSNWVSSSLLKPEKQKKQNNNKSKQTGMPTISIPRKTSQ